MECRKHLRWQAVRDYLAFRANRLMRGQTIFFRLLWLFNKVYDKNLLVADLARPVAYRIPEPPRARGKVDLKSLYIHAARGRHGRQIDSATERLRHLDRRSSLIFEDRQPDAAPATQTTRLPILSGAAQCRRFGSSVTERGGVPAQQPIDPCFRTD